MFKMVLKKWIVVGLSVGILGAVGCATKGKDFVSDVSWIKTGVTKQEDVRLVLGSPYQVGFASGYPTWTYGYYKYRLVGESPTKELKFYWNPDGTVQNFAFTSSFNDDVRKSVVKNNLQPSNVPQTQKRH